MNTEVICDLQFNPKYPDVLVISGKEYLSWWKIYPESRMIQPLAQPDYEVWLWVYTSDLDQEFHRTKHSLMSNTKEKRMSFHGCYRISTKVNKCCFEIQKLRR